MTMQERKTGGGNKICVFLAFWTGGKGSGFGILKSVMHAKVPNEHCGGGLLLYFVA